MVPMEQVLTDALKSNHATAHYLLGTALQNQQKYSDALQARKKHSYSTFHGNEHYLACSNSVRSVQTDRMSDTQSEPLV